MIDTGVNGAAIPLILAFLQALTDLPVRADHSEIEALDEFSADVEEFTVSKDVDDELATKETLRDEVRRFNACVAVFNAEVARFEKAIEEFNSSIDAFEDEADDYNGVRGEIADYAERLILFAEGRGGGALLPFTV